MNSVEDLENMAHNVFTPSAYNTNKSNISDQTECNSNKRDAIRSDCSISQRNLINTGTKYSNARTGRYESLSDSSMIKHTRLVKEENLSDGVIDDNVLDAIESQAESDQSSVIKFLETLPKIILNKIKTYIEHKCKDNPEFFQKHQNAETIYDKVNELLNDLNTKQQEELSEKTKDIYQDEPLYAEEIAINPSTATIDETSIEHQAQVETLQNNRYESKINNAYEFSTPQEVSEDISEQNDYDNYDNSQYSEIDDTTNNTDVFTVYDIREYVTLNEFTQMEQDVRKLLKTADETTCHRLLMWVEHQNPQILESSIKKTLRKEIENASHIAGMREIAIKYTKQIQNGTYALERKKMHILSSPEYSGRLTNGQYNSLKNIPLPEITVSETEQFKELHDLKEDIRTWPNDVQKLPEFKKLQEVLNEQCPDVNGQLEQSHQEIIDQAQRLMSPAVYTQYKKHRDIYFDMLDKEYFKLQAILNDPNTTNPLFIQELNKAMANLSICKDDIKAMRRGESYFQIISTPLEANNDRAIEKGITSLRVLKQLLDTKTNNTSEYLSNIFMYERMIESRVKDVENMLSNRESSYDIPNIQDDISQADATLNLAYQYLDDIRRIQHGKQPKILTAFKDNNNLSLENQKLLDQPIYFVPTEEKLQQSWKDYKGEALRVRNLNDVKKHISLCQNMIKQTQDSKLIDRIQHRINYLNMIINENS